MRGRGGGDAQARKRWRELVRLGASSGERELFEGYGITAVSADLTLILAASQGVPVLHIDSGNLPSALDQLPYDGEVEYAVEALDSWKIFARGEAQTGPGIVDPVIAAWVTAKGFPDPKSQVVRDAMKGAACRESKYENFRGDPLNFFPKVSQDGGYGLFQLTTPAPAPAQVWDWVKNLEGAGGMLADCYESARSFLTNPDRINPIPLHWDPTIPVPQYTLDQLMKETLACYNAGPGSHYHRPVFDAGRTKITGVEADLAPGQYCDRTGDNNSLFGPGGFVKYSGICYADRTDCP